QTLHAAHAEAAASSADGANAQDAGLAPEGESPSSARAHAGLAGGNAPLARGFRLAVDRVFTLDGVGTVATGTVHAGSLRVGDVLDVLPDGPRGVRVRSLRAQNRETAEAVKGQRCAVGLAGIEKSSLSRGEWLLQPGVAELSTRLDVEIHLWHGEEKPLRSGMRVHVHMGTESVMASVAVLGVRQPQGETAPQQSAVLLPGHVGLVQLVLQAPVSACWGDRLILRDASGSRVLAGGRVLDVLGPARYRATPARLSLLACLQAADITDALAGVLRSTPEGMSLVRWQRNFGLRDLASLERWLGTQPCLRLSASVVMHEAAWQSLRQGVSSALQHFHDTHAEELGPDVARLRRLVHVRMDEEAWRAALQQMQTDGLIRLHGAFVHLPGHGEELAERDRVLMEKVMPLLIEAGAQGAWVRDMAAHVDTPVDVLRGTMARLARSGHVYQVVRDLFLDEATTIRLAALIRALAAQGVADGEGRQELNVAAFRDATGLGRKRAVQLLEFFDRIGLCRRVGDSHLLRADSQ
ncbi:MAG: SelB C-terminal domain-containing protein, partial [Lautropia sp.]|nr:SelB C-terminal domain-containing protein [Lautropia sp.]